MQRILITGASGFIGSFLVEEAVDRGFETWAGIRSTSSRRFLTKEGIRFLELDFTSKASLHRTLADCAPFDYVIHCAGATKCVNEAEFDEVNYRQTRYLIEVLYDLGKMPRRFLFVSTLGVFGPLHEHDYAPIREDDRPAPNTAYGRSKLKAEQYMQSLPDLPYVIFRPTGVYGPREADYFLMVKSIARHMDFAAGFRRQDLTFVYVKDVVQAVFKAIERQVSRRSYFLTDGEVYSGRDFSRLIERELGHPFVFRFVCPLWMLKGISLLSQWWANRSGRTSTLNADKYKIMKQRNWRCDISPTIDELGYEPAYQLDRGVAETVAWYKQEGWL